MRRYRALLAYDGGAYQGFQRQPAGVPTIQAAVEAALYEVTGQPVTVTGAGRTDTGVHASGQVIAFDAAWRHPEGALLRAINANLPADIAVWDLSEAPAGFHPRFDARRRVYLYRLYCHPIRDPLRDRYMWRVHHPLDAAAAAQACAGLLGRRDFWAFGDPPQGENSVRTVFCAEWRSQGDEHSFLIEADAFLHRMVRRLVGTLAAVGQGMMTSTDFDAILSQRQREKTILAPPHGLTLVAVKYETEPLTRSAGAGAAEE